MNINSNSHFDFNSWILNPSTDKEQVKKEYDEPVRASSCFYIPSQEPATYSSPSIWFPLKKLLKWTLTPNSQTPNFLGSCLPYTSPEFKYKRLSIPVGRMLIDATVMAQPSAFKKKRWVLVSVGREERYENFLMSDSLKNFLTRIQAGAVFFNYPKVGLSQGPRNSHNLVAAYKSMLEFLEDKKRGLGAKEIIGHGYSMGGGVQGKALETYPLEKGLKKGIKYIFIKDRTFSSLKRTVHSLTKGYIGHNLPLLGWDLDSVQSSKRLAKLGIPEIIIQTTDAFNKPVTDGVISKNASLKEALQRCSLPNKWYLNILNPLKEPLHFCRKVRFDTTLSRKVLFLLGRNERQT